MTKVPRSALARLVHVASARTVDAVGTLSVRLSRYSRPLLDERVRHSKRPRGILMSSKRRGDTLYGECSICIC